MGILKIPVEPIRVHERWNRTLNKEHVHAIARHMNDDGFNGAFPLQVVLMSSL